MTVALNNPILWTVLFAWLAAQIVKAIIEFRLTRRITWRVLFGMGGMPSSHSATVTSLAMAVGLRTGFDSAIFAVTAVLAAVVMTDAAGVRRAAGRHASILNWILADFADDPADDEPSNSQPALLGMNVPYPLQELLGHTPAQVVVGGALGVVVAVLHNLVAP